MRSKILTFHNAVIECNYNIIALTETWLSDDISNAEICNNNYDVYRKDRDKICTDLSRGGGVLIAVMSNLKSRQISLANSSGLIEQICVCVSLPYNLNEISIYIFNSYIPPKSSFDIYTAHINNISEIVKTLDCNSYVVVLGDFNLSKVIWMYSEDDKALLPYNVVNENETLLLDTMSALNCIQMNNVVNSIGRILDLVFVQEDLEIDLTEEAFPLLNNCIHHKALRFELKCLRFYNFDCSNQEIDYKYDFAKADYIGINNFLNSVDWNVVLCFQDLERNYKTFQNIIYEAFSSYIPVKRMKKNNKPVWFTKSLSRLKNTLNKTYKMSKVGSGFRSEYCRIRREYDFLKKFLYKQYVWSLESNIKSNSKCFWQYINSKRKSVGIPAYMTYKGIGSSDLNKICNLFASFFRSNFRSNPAHSELNYNMPTIIDMGYIYISEEEILSALGKLENSDYESKIKKIVQNDVDKKENE
ncbi:uncharacterized protein LOC129915173 [Episyrphus balteatus]|uniref:uncharacterized protein LOC129915173 n=1 Tax=Episyrphus balteatus TaxID=286459 RepID=UPI0024858B3D|nr:uncharacterized protein LOC129915173 [Episyrphus balteatus]